MEEGVKMRDFEDCVGDGDDDRIFEWEDGLPSSIDLTPLSQALISPELASAFSISAEPYRSMNDVHRASQNTMSNLRRQNSGFSSKNIESLHSFMEDRNGDSLVIEGDEPDLENSTKDVTEKRKVQSLDGGEEADLVFGMENSTDDQSARTLKRARLVWTPQLHKRFVDVVSHLGIKNAVPKTIMQMMNVEGLTRENVASHLQKYRLYLKRMHGLSDEGPSEEGLLESGGSGHMPPPPMPYGGPLMPMPMPMHGVGPDHGHMGMPVGHGFEFHPYNVFREQRDWSGNMFGSIVPYHHGAPNEK